MKLNRKGYLIVEIIVASVLAMGIAFFLVRLTISFSRTDEDIYKSITFTNNKNIITNKIMNDINDYTLTKVEKKGDYSVVFTYSNSTSNIEKELSLDNENKSITYGNYTKNIGKSLEIGSASFEVKDNYTSIIIPITNIYNSEDYSIRLFIPYSVTGLISMVSLGDYVSYIPTSTSYTTDTSKTGYDSAQTINPSELNLWRVLKINDDGTVDIISEYVSSTQVYFQGKKGYLNLVGYLNELAKQYENNNYTKSSRYFGYNGQTRYITDDSKFTYPASLTTSTSNNNSESQGGGDILFSDDYNQLKKALDNTLTTKPGESNVAEYWMASRWYYYYSSTHYIWLARIMHYSGQHNGNTMYGYDGSSFHSYSLNYSLRPIVTLKAELTYSGKGTKESPIVLLQN